MRTFEHFPDRDKCPICQTNDDKECILIAIDGTQEGNISEAKPTHTDCIELRLNQEQGIIYQAWLPK